MRRRAAIGLLRYRDIELMLVAEPDRGDTWVMKVTFMFLKGNHQRSNPKTFALHEDEVLVFCHVLQFLAIAFAAQGISVSQLDNVRVNHPLKCQIFNRRTRCWIFLYFVNPFKLARECELHRIVLANIKFSSAL